MTRVAGIMSGTSVDGIDVAIVDVTGRRAVRTVAFHSTPFSAKMRAAILSVSNAVTHTAAVSRLNFQLGELYAKAVRETCRRARVPLTTIELIGCHGQTIYHESGRNTLQIGEAAVIAERTGIPVVSNFRPRDIAAGGKGAPLVPFVDALLFRHPRRTRVALNIGGIANITVIPPRGEVIAFDTGPGNMVIDGLVAEHTRGRRRFDRNGRLATQGNLSTPWLARFLRDPYYRARPPKSVGREQYGAGFLARLRATKLPLLDQITLATVLTASTIALAIRTQAPNASELIVSGGGSHNPEILAHLSALLPDVAIATSTEYGIDADAKEAIAFAILANETWRHRPGNLPAATGARRPVILGQITPA